MYTGPDANAVRKGEREAAPSATACRVREALSSSSPYSPGYGAGAQRARFAAVDDVERVPRLPHHVHFLDRDRSTRIIEHSRLDNVE